MELEVVEIDPPSTSLPEHPNPPTASLQTPNPPITNLQTSNPLTTYLQTPNPRPADEPPSGIDHDIVQQCIDYCREKKIEDPVEILRVAQQFIVTGRQLEVISLTECLEGETNYILINRQDVLDSAIEEISPLINPRLTLGACSCMVMYK